MFQHHAGRYVLHRHFVVVTRWKASIGVMVLENLEGVIRTQAHMCRYGVIGFTDEGYIFVRKCIGSSTHSPSIASQPNLERIRDYVHIKLEGRIRTRQIQIYPEELSKALCKSFKEQNQLNAQGLCHIGTVGFVGIDEWEGSVKQSEGMREEEEDRQEA